jgi:uncharacterized secreted protein with C-terminal beta-propeller domain
LTIGMGPGEADGTGLDWSSTRLSLFNITDPTAPAVDDHLSLTPVADPADTAWMWSYSEASYEHKAFQYWAPKGLLAIPLSTYRYQSWTDSNGGYHWNYQYVSKLILVNVSEETGNLSVHGTVDHSDLYDRDDNQNWWNGFNIRRSIFMGDFVYAISSAGVTATNLTTMDESASVELAYVNPYNTYYYDDAVDSDAGESTTSEGGSSNTNGDDKTDSSNTDGSGSEPDSD